MDRSTKVEPPSLPKAQNSYPPIRTGHVVGLLLTLVIPISLIVFWNSGLGVFGFWETILRRFLYIVVLIILPILCSPLAFYNAAALKRPRLNLLGLVLGVIPFIGAAYGIFFHGYLVGHSYESVSVEEETQFADRAPWVVANNFAMRDQGDVIGDRENVRFVPTYQDAEASEGEGTSRYGVLVKARGPLGTGGYEAVQTLTMPTTGPIPSDASSFCSVPDHMNKRLDTFWPWHSLSWAIHSQRPLAHYKLSDSYGYCDGDTPVVVVPLFRYEGFWNVTKAPAGVAVYTPEGLSIQDQVDESVSGPTYPMSVAKAQREALNAGGSITDWWGSRYGYDLTDKDEEDANADNSSEFLLVDGGGALQFTTPLTPRGSSQSITAISMVPGRQSGPERTPITVNTYPDLPATSTLVTSIKESSVQGDNAWTTRWASGMTVYEVLPARDGHWVASIGQGQAVSYRADIAPNGTVTVVNSETGQSSDGDAQQPVGVAVGDKPLSEMSSEELLNLIAEAAAELQQR